MFLHVTNQKNEEFILTVVYGSNDGVVRMTFWWELISFASTNSLPFFFSVLGDFNAILNSQEKVGGAEVQPADLIDLLNMVHQTGLFDCT